MRALVLKTLKAWNAEGYELMYGEESEHKNKMGEKLYRRDQVEEYYYDEPDENEESWWLSENAGDR